MGMRGCRKLYLKPSVLGRGYRKAVARGLEELGFLGLLDLFHRFWVWSLGFRIWGFRFRVWVTGLGGFGLGFKV